MPSQATLQVLTYSSSLNFTHYTQRQDHKTALVSLGLNNTESGVSLDPANSEALRAGPTNLCLTTPIL